MAFRTLSAGTDQCILSVGQEVKPLVCPVNDPVKVCGLNIFFKRKLFLVGIAGIGCIRKL